MEIRPLEAKEEAVWDRFCLENSGAWFWQTTAYLKYQEAYRPALKTEAKHFMLVRDGRPVAVCPLAVETLADGRRALSLGGDALPGPVVSDALAGSDRERVLRAAFDQIDATALADKAVKASFRDSALTPRYLKPTVAPANDYVRFGCFEADYHTQVLELLQDEAPLWAGLRKSYHSPIRRAEESLVFRALDKLSITDEAFGQYQALHKKDAGRLTRPVETFQMMLGWIRGGQGLLAQALQTGRVAACALTILYKDRAYYASGCTDPDLDAAALGPFLQWRLIRALRERGVGHYELGWQFHGPQLAYLPDEKERAIAFFKRGFGGLTFPFHRGEKYYDADYFRLEYGRRIEQAAAALRSAPTT